MTADPPINSIRELLGWAPSPGGLGALQTYVTLLKKWQPAQNLVASETLQSVWTRHIADALQLIPLIDSVAKELSTDRRSSMLGSEDSVGRLTPPCGSDVSPTVFDLGSGAGLPGAVLALATHERTKAPAYDVHLVESNQRKCAFLRAVSRETGVPFQVHTQRIEAFAKGPRSSTNDATSPLIITARALASVHVLMTWAGPWIDAGAIGIFHKGGDVHRELADWPDATNYDVVIKPSRVDATGHILIIRRAA